MRSSSDFARVTKQIVGDQSPREFAAEVGVSHSTVYDMLAGRIPSYRIVQQVAERRGVDARTRARFFTAAGYVDHTAPADAAGFSPKVAEVAREMEQKGLTTEELDTVQRLIQDRRQIGAVAVLLDSRVMYGELVSVGSCAG